MQRITPLVLALAALLAASGPAAAEIGAMDEIPSATLLLPYFEVSLDHDGITTLLAVSNAADEAVLTHFTVWSDQGVVVLDFVCYLTGYDVVTVNLRDVLVDGKLCRTASDGQDPADTISPQGVISQDINIASCAGFLPYPAVAVDAANRAHIQAWLTGNQSPLTGNCAGADHDGNRTSTGNRIMRGYVTVDTVNACNLFVPTMLATTYDAFLTDQNVLWGDYFLIDPKQNFAQGETLVHLEACTDPSEGCPFEPGEHTFYGRYASATAIDQREPLPTTLMARYVNGGAFNGGTSYLMWREGNQTAAAYNCTLPGPPSWHPLDSTQVVIFDEQENPVVSETCPGFPCVPEIVFPDLAQRVDVTEDLLTPFDFGWVFLNLQHDAINASYGDDDAQAWITVVMDASARFSVGFDAVQVDNANKPYSEPPLPVP